MGTTRLYLAGDVHVHAIRALFTDFPVPPLQTPQLETNAAQLDDIATDAKSRDDNEAAESEGDAAVPAWTKPRSPLALEGSSKNEEGAAQDTLPPRSHQGSGDESSNTERNNSPSPTSMESAKSAEKGHTAGGTESSSEFPRVDPDSIRPAFFQVRNFPVCCCSRSSRMMRASVLTCGETGLLHS